MPVLKETGLYRRFELAAAPAKPFCMCGSELSADAAHKLIGHLYVATAWPEAPAGWQWVDVTALKGREGLLIPDATPDSRQDMLNMAARLHGLGITKLRFTSLNGQPEDWKIADWTGTNEEFIAWAKPHTADYVPPEPEPPEEDIPPEDLAAAKPWRRKQRPALAVVGNTALAPAEAQPAPLSQDALAEHFVDKHGEDWRYVAQWGKWFEWDCNRWAEDATEKPVGLAKQVTREAITWQEAAQLTNSDRRKVNSIVTAKALLGFARADQAIAATVDQWDTDPWLLGVPGGVLELQSGKMLEADRGQYITKQCAVAPANGTPAKWLAFLNRVTDDNQPLIDFLHRCAGYWLTGSAREHSLTFLYGTGANGKSVFMRTMGGILGVDALQYAASCQMSVFTESKVERHSTELARLRGARLVIAEETAGGAKWDQAKIQWLTGEGSVTARFMRQDDFTFKPAFKLLFAGNHKPMLRSVDEAIKRRFHLVPFTVTIPEADRDLQLYEKLREEWPQILGWMVDGCMAWQRTGLQPPDAVRDATNTYLETEDALGQWLEECCERSAKEEGSRLYGNYRAWCDKNSEHAWSRRAWSNALVERNFLLKKGAHGARMFEGLSLKPSAPEYPSRYPAD